MMWVLVAIAAATLVYFKCIRPLGYWSERGIVQYTPRVIWQEILLGLIPYRSIADSIRKYYDDFPGKRYAGIYQFFKPALLLRDPDLIKQICVKDFDHFVDHRPAMPENSEPLWERNLFALKGEKWKEMRSTLSPSFTSSKMKVMFGLMGNCAKQFVEHFEEQGPQTTTVEMKDVFSRFANDVIASTAFGITCNSLRDKNNEFYLKGKELTDFRDLWASIRFIIISLVPGVAKILGIKFVKESLNNYYRNIIKTNIEARETNGVVRYDMIHLLLEARKGKSNNESVSNENEESSVNVKTSLQKRDFTDEDITSQALIFFFAGFESVSTVMCFLAHEIAVNSDVQQKLRNEVDDALKSCDGNVTYEALMRMKYLDMVVSETLRKWNGAIITDRMCVKDYVIQPENDEEKPVYLKKGDVVLLPLFALHRDPQYYPDPDRFDPERFSEENRTSIDPYTFVPFGVGPRSCIANRFALMEIKLVFFYILSRFEIKVVDKTSDPLKIARNQFQLSAEGGFWLGLKARS